ncbi:MAG: hypothetical protein AABX29_09080 [Nanoarchaeota archaeon]
MAVDNKNRIILILVIVVVILALALSYKFLKDYNNKNLNLAYQTGVRDASLQFQQNIITQLNSFGFFSVTLPAENNQTITVRLVPSQPTPQITEEEKK